MKFYYCSHCKNVIVKLSDSGVNTVCCGDVMDLLVYNNVDAAMEKHVPILTLEGNIAKVNVGSVNHPMEENHYIEFIVLETSSGFFIKYINPGDNPSAIFNISDDILNVYSYCNLHGLWKI